MATLPIMSTDRFISFGNFCRSRDCCLLLMSTDDELIIATNGTLSHNWTGSMFVLFSGETAACTNWQMDVAFAWLPEGRLRAAHFGRESRQARDQPPPEIKQLDNMQLRPGSLPSLSLRRFPSTKGLDFSAVGCILHPDRYLWKTHFTRIFVQTIWMCMLVNLQKRARRVVAVGRANICHLQQQQRNFNIYYQLISSLRYLRALNW